jgi:hypothetical protein
MPELEVIFPHQGERTIKLLKKVWSELVKVT